MDAETVTKLQEIGATQVEPKTLAGFYPFVVVPHDFKVESLEGLREYPSRIKSTVQVFNPDSFLAYWKPFATPSSQIFADVQKPALVGMLDYHEPADTQKGEEGHLPRWGTHRLNYVFRPTKEWEIWAEKNNKPMKQIEFAQFIEDNMLDIVNPDPATMYEVARTFDAKKSVNFSSAVRLENHQVQFKYEETITAGNAKQDNFVVPDQFDISVAPFEGSEHYKVGVRFRYKLAADGLTLRYELIRPHKIIEDAVYVTVGKIQDGLGEGKSVIYGHSLNGTV